MKKHLRLLLSLFFFISFTLCACSNSKLSSRKNNVMIVHYIDVGQGDSILIQVNGINMLIDAGPADNADNLISYLKKQKIRKLDYVIATHPHEDHIGGMSSVIRKFSIGKFYAPKIQQTPEILKTWLQPSGKRVLRSILPVKESALILGK